jgi:tRNA G18 (ribose-2'-O)-methylase SpoU
VLRVPFARTVPWPDALDELRELDFTTVALTPNRAAESLRALVTDPPPRVALLVGAEGPGLTGRSLAAADKRVRIPMADEVDSVNVATAVAIVLSALFER